MKLNKLILPILFLVSLSLLSCRPQTKPPPNPAPSPTPASFLTVTPPPGPSPLPTPALDAAVLRERASQAVAAVTTYRFDLAVAVRRAIKKDGELTEMRLSLRSLGALDIPARQMRMENSLNVKLPPPQQQPPLMETIIFVLGDGMYIRGPSPLQPEQWARTRLPEDYWQSQNQAQQQMELLKLSEVEVLAPETIVSGGRETPTHVLRVTPHLERFWQIVAHQPGVNLMPQPPPGVPLSQMVRRPAMKVWLSEATALPVKAEMEASFHIDPTIVAGAPGELSLDIGITMLFYDYNQPVSIELPAEAREAMELGGTGSS